MKNIYISVFASRLCLEVERCLTRGKAGILARQLRIRKQRIARFSPFFQQIAKELLILNSRFAVILSAELQ